jgi:hypothetical protein
MTMIVLAILSGGVLAALADWLFLGVLFREARGNYPEVWWPAIRDRETGPAKVWTVLLGFVATAAVVLLCATTHIHGVTAGLEVSLLAFIAPAAFLLTAFQFIKMDLWVMAAAGFSWLTRFLIAGLLAGLLLP